MELDQLFNILKVVCLNNKDSQHTDHYETILHQFQHWIVQNEMDYNSIKADISANGKNTILQWFQFHEKPELFKHIVDIIINRTKQQQLAQLDQPSFDFFASYLPPDSTKDEDFQIDFNPGTINPTYSLIVSTHSLHNLHQHALHHQQ